MCLLRQVRGAGANNSVTMMPIFMDENTRWQMMISICQLCCADDTINIPLTPSNITYKICFDALPNYSKFKDINLIS
jgi:hypothetical protein